jgi:hypothetical protein
MKAIFALLACAMLISQAHGEGIKRNELKRADLTGKDMDIIVTVLEVPPGENLGQTYPSGRRGCVCPGGSNT